LIQRISTLAQTNFEKFFNLSGPKKTWVLLHRFKAVKSLEISNEDADSIRKTNLLDGVYLQLKLGKLLTSRLEPVAKSSHKVTLLTFQLEIS
jgi:hypothetical protein